MLIVRVLGTELHNLNGQAPNPYTPESSTPTPEPEQTNRKTSNAMRAYLGADGFHLCSGGSETDHRNQHLQSSNILLQGSFEVQGCSNCTWRVGGLTK